MQAVASEVGYSETAFVAPLGEQGWRVRYFAPEIEIPFCGHATIALGALLAKQQGSGPRRLILNDAEITVEGIAGEGVMGATFLSPPTHSRPADPATVAEALRLFAYEPAHLDPRIPFAIANAGNDHLVIALRDRETLSRLAYDLDAGRAFMLGAGFATVTFVFAETPQRLHVRNPFASGGVYEDPATGSAAAALGGYLARIGWPGGDKFTIAQGDDMGVPCRITIDAARSDTGRVRVSGSARFLDGGPGVPRGMLSPHHG